MARSIFVKHRSYAIRIALHVTVHDSVIRQASRVLRRPSISLQEGGFDWIKEKVGRENCGGIGKGDFGE